MLNGDATIFNQSFFEINEDFVMNGAFLGNSPGIVKTGDATLTLNGDNQYQGFTRVNGGTLEVNGTIGGNNVLVNSGGTLSGTGTIASDIVASSGGIVSPGNSPGTLTATDATFRDGSTLMIQLGSLTDFDQLALSGLLTVDTGANLGLSLLDGFMPNVGDEFKVLDFNSSTGTFNIANAPTLAQGNWDFSSLGTNGIISVVAVPEPSSTVALLTAIGLVGSGRRRRRNL